jgi:hypothetical protein
MPVNIIPVDVYPANFTTFADGDAVSQANFVNSMQEFADAITYLRNRTVPAVPFAYAQPLGAPAGPIGTFSVGGAFVYTMATQLWNESAGAGDSITWATDFGGVLPVGGGPFQIVEILCWTINAAHLAGPTPVPAQTVSLDYHDPAGGSALLQNVTSFSDPSNGTDLATLHSFSSGAIAHTVLPGASYAVTYTGENLQPGADIHAIVYNLEPV